MEILTLIVKEVLNTFFPRDKARDKAERVWDEEALLIKTTANP